VRNGRSDFLAANRLGYALYACKWRRSGHRMEVPAQWCPNWSNGG
jgi:hypothetical protein